MNIRIDFAYNDRRISSCNIPRERLSHIYKMSEPPRPTQLRDEILRASARPIGAPKLSELIKGKKRIAILVDDLTRPTPVDQILPFILEELSLQGVRSEQVTLVIALGSHRPMTESEILQKLGRQVARNYRVLNSRFDEPDHLVHVGTSEDGVPILIEEEVAKADLKIGIGSITPHGAVGWSGGGKIVYPGVAGRETVMRFHFAHGLTEENMTGKDDCSVRLKMEKWVDILGLDFVVNSILTPDDQVYRIVAGHYLHAQRSGVVFAKKVYLTQIREKVDIVLSASYAHDTDFWQAAKGIYGPDALVKDGGTLLLVTPCPEGSGPHTEFLPRIGRDDNRDVLQSILQGKTKLPADPISLAPAAMLAKMRKRVHCCIVSPGLRSEEIVMAGYEQFDDAQSGIDTLIKRYPDGKVAVVLRSDLAFNE
ncbi:MAG: nickel-dependent lactate racemase [Spirochaetia bacterium]|jgi:nickel-dependent lactate racemase